MNLAITKRHLDGVVSFRCDYGKPKKEIMRREMIVPYLRDAIKAARKDVPVIGQMFGFNLVRWDIGTKVRQAICSQFFRLSFG